MSDNTNATDKPKRRGRHGRGHIFKRKNGSYAIVVNLGTIRDAVSGKTRCRQKWVTVHGIRKDAETRLTELLRAIDTNLFVAPAKLTTAMWLDEWLTKLVKPLRRLNTYRLYKVAVERRIVPALGDIALQKLKPADVTNFLVGLTAEGLKPSTVRLYGVVLGAALNAAVEQGLVLRNVATRVKGRPKAERRDAAIAANCWDADEARRFLTYVKTEGSSQDAAMFAVGLASGARKGELLGLPWSHVDFDASSIKIEQQLIRPSVKDKSTGEYSKWVAGPPKQGGTRTIKMDDATMRLLLAHKRAQAALRMKNRTVYHDEGLAFAREHEHMTPHEPDALGLPLNAWVIFDRFKRLAKAAGVREITLHGLRHTSATMLLANGTPAADVARRLGHATAAITLSVYAHALPAHEEAGALRLGALLHG